MSKSQIDEKLVQEAKDQQENKDRSKSVQMMALPNQLGGLGGCGKEAEEKDKNVKSDQELGCALGEARPTWNFVVFLSFVLNIK